MKKHHMDLVVDESKRLLEQTMVQPVEKFCADCGGRVGVKPLWMSAGVSGLCFSCAEAVYREMRQATMWAADQLGGRERKRVWLMGIFRLRREATTGEFSAAWLYEFSKAIQIVWDHVQHDSNVAQTDSRAGIGNGSGVVSATNGTGL